MVEGCDDEAVAEVEVRLPIDGIVLIRPGHVPDRDARPTCCGIARLAGADAELGVVPLDEQRQRLADRFGDLARVHAHPPAVVVDIDAAVQVTGVRGIRLVAELALIA